VSVEHVLFGVDDLIADRSQRGPVRRVGLVTNDAARLAADSTVHSRVALLKAGVPVVRLFGPEHGLAGTAADGAAVPDSIDPLTGVPTTSLYGDRMQPTRELIEGLDLILFDIPDVGARFYTYIWTLYHLLGASEQQGVRVVVLDRPNPLRGDLSLAEGPVLDLRYRSFIGEDRIPIRHQLTIGELARLWRAERFPTLSLTVLPVRGWTRDRTWSSLGLPWVATSPAMPSCESALWYPGSCLFEATTLSVGRGTDAPFQQFGAPWLDAEAVSDDLASRSAIDCSPCSFTPRLGPFAGETCAGVQFPTEPASPGPVAVGLLALAAVLRRHPNEFRWQTYPTAANPTGAGHFERLIGVSGIREQLEQSPERIDLDQVRRWTDPRDWHQRLNQADALIYPRPNDRQTTVTA
jgi:uncharacterized protein YbbC (DUF1343 family)